MRIAITASGDTLDAQMDRRFDGARYILILKSDGTFIEACTSPDSPSAHDPRRSRLCALLAAKNVNCVITGLCMSGAREILERAGIKVVEAPSKTVREAFEHFAYTERLLT